MIASLAFSTLTGIVEGDTIGVKVSWHFQTVTTAGEPPVDAPGNTWLQSDVVPKLSQPNYNAIAILFTTDGTDANAGVLDVRELVVSDK